MYSIHEFLHSARKVSMDYDTIMVCVLNKAVEKQNAWTGGKYEFVIRRYTAIAKRRQHNIPVFLSCYGRGRYGEVR